MKLIYDIFQKLKKQEIRQIRHQINHATFEYEKVGKLFELVTRYPQKEEAFYSQKLYGRDPDNTFRVTKSRLKRMLENSLLHDKSLTGYSSPAINARLQTRKKLLQGEILLGRGAYEASRNLLLQTISAAKKYDLQEEILQAEMLLYRHTSITSSVRDYQKQTQSLLHLNQQMVLINEALILHLYITNLLLHKVIKRPELQDVREKIDRIAEISQETSHPRVLYVYYLSENYYHQVTTEYSKAIEFCHKLLELMSEAPSQHSQQRETAAYVQLAKVSIQTGDEPTARQYIDLILERYSPKEINFLMGLELAFKLEFYREQYEAAQEIIDRAFLHPQFNSAGLISPNWHYFHSCLLFKREKYKEAYRALDYTTPLLADKFGHNITIRLLEIMILYNLQHLDIMETKILNIRQFIKRTHQGEEIFRPLTLIKILMKWYRHNYNFGETVIDSKVEFDALEDYHNLFPFDTSDFELIRLEKWLLEHLT